MEKLYLGAEKLGLRLTPRQLEQLDTYYQRLVDWNQRMNLTAITDYKKVQLKHFLDSLTVTLAWQLAKDTSVIDVGTGAGMPGIPLKVAFPEIKLTLLEATAKKVAFLRHIIQELELDGVEVIDGRAEEVAHIARFRENFNLVLSRAVAPLPTLVELTLPFASVGGRLIAQKKGNVEEEVNLAAKAIGLVGGRLGEVRRIELKELADERYLVVIDKVTPTPQNYPRRPGVPAKRPLG